ncbi:tRNA threonylcarbamoyladenosine biosynthesis protein RimN [Halomonas sp. S2151]|jgi:L-threonylcarbamoyladenylate synthase|uniref:Threonylcarbamoyl-AMP synthase n=2 Tax=unclassified Halomonas TaxID=2609666 RepID=A0AAU7KJF7_9GAMM|nr:MULTISPECIES: Sua5/YciO/YrdC/YwlC family protein [unclassified Halomonas]MBR9770876.1 tRNA threonylcarbamoyladenosine biosynthesis protein RimN [Gammaproteobacteria bacterium]MBS8268451.1 tRNA threonylcarbamoyladenosine biosynthesis protein RimN [Halomonas litopenaei]KJZ14539.1 tRNA threonylcarbamoyladenosine biosynthesis protein RimN [Halomonas sp. S2151]MBY5939999.1 Sua5/YciO/YrdC/YwlC family protein [Halomonas sp. DP5N14-9]RQW69283.1 tRNA threonylcarbamoyladenosine biosynthesis protein R
MSDSDSSLVPVVDALRRGGVIAYPTEAVWGLGCDPDNEEALTRLLRLKRRDPAKGVILIAATIEQFAPWLEGLPADLHAPLVASWPGPNTWLVPDNGRTPSLVRGCHDKVALRVSDHPGVQALCRAFGGPLVSTSANRAGEAPAMSEADIRRIFGNELDAVVPGALGGNPRPSTIRDLLSRETLRH